MTMTQAECKQFLAQGANTACEVQAEDGNKMKMGIFEV